MAYVEPDPPIQGWMSPGELQWLYDQARYSYWIAEIGCWRGRSTHALLSGAPGFVFAIDHFEGSPSERETTHKAAVDTDVQGEFLHNLRQFHNLRVVAMSSLEAVQRFNDECFDLVFIDGDHEYSAVLADLRAWWPKVRKGGLIAGHDRTEAGVPKALQDFFNYNPGVARESIWCVKKFL